MTDIDDKLAQIAANIADIRTNGFSGEIAALRTTNDGLVKALEKYGRHSTPGHFCASMVNSANKCDCGLDEALATQQNDAGRS